MTADGNENGKPPPIGKTPVRAVASLPPLFDVLKAHPALSLGKLSPLFSIGASLRAHGATLTAMVGVSKALWPTSPVLDAIRRNPGHLGLGLFGPIGEWLGRYPERMEVALPVMAKAGWYLDANMPASIPTLFAEATHEGDTALAETMMVAHFEKRLDAIEQELAERYPHRAHLFSAAFAAHRRGEYVLAIPVLFTQVDGVCRDRGAKFAYFITEARRALATQLKDGAASRLEEVFLTPFDAASPLFASQRDRPEGFAALNRHQVLHGESVDYGTCANSFRAISLLAYVTQRLSVLDADTDDGAAPDEAA